MTENLAEIENEGRPSNMSETLLGSEEKLWFLDHTSESVRSVCDCIMNVFANITQDESAKNALLEFGATDEYQILCPIWFTGVVINRVVQNIRMLTAYYVPLRCISRIPQRGV